MGFFMDWSAKP